MTKITLDLTYYWVCVGLIVTALAGYWGFRRIKGMFSNKG